VSIYVILLRPVSIDHIVRHFDSTTSQSTGLWKSKAAARAAAAYAWHVACVASPSAAPDPSQVDYAADQEEEVCALQAILFDEFQGTRREAALRRGFARAHAAAELDPESPDALPNAAKSYQISIRPEGDDDDAQVETDCECVTLSGELRRHRCSPPAPVRLSLTFAHPARYPDEPPLLRVRRRVPRRALCTPQLGDRTATASPQRPRSVASRLRRAGGAAAGYCGG